MIGQEIASIHWSLVAFTAMRKSVRLAEKMESISADGQRHRKPTTDRLCEAATVSRRSPQRTRDAFS